MQAELVFHDGVADADGWARVTRTHHQPGVLTARIARIDATLADPDTFPMSPAKREELADERDNAMALLDRGVLVPVSPPPRVRRGWIAVRWVHLDTQATEWRVEIDEDYRMSAAEYLLQVPVQARIAARQAASGGDPVMQDFIDMLDRMIADNASSGLHPGGTASKVALGYLVQQGWMTEADAAAITEP